VSRKYFSPIRNAKEKKMKGSYKASLVTLALLATIGSASAATGAVESVASAKTETTVNGGVVRTSGNLRGERHGEVIVFTKDASGPGGNGVFYNTLGLPGGFTDSQWEALDPDVLKVTFHGDAIWENGPRESLMDTATALFLDGGEVTNIGDIPMRKAGSLDIPNLEVFLSGKIPPYKERVIQRTTVWVFNSGSEVYELVAPDGAVYVMQSCSQNIDSSATTERLPTLGTRLNLPDGWHYRVRTLDSDLVVRANAGEEPAHIVFDEFEKNYQRVQ
jgi:hypothetical protein